jgi:hypothetical protein
MNVNGQQSNDLSETRNPMQVTLFKLSSMTLPDSQGVVCLSLLIQFCFHLYFPAVCGLFPMAIMYKLQHAMKGAT